MIKRISLKPFYGKVFRKNNIFVLKNDGNNAFYKIDVNLEKKGILINTSDIARNKNVDLNIYANLPYPWEIFDWLKLAFSNKRKNILFCFESPLVNPFNQMKILHWNFNKVYTWDDSLVDGIKYFKFNIPMQFENALSLEILKNKQLLVAINSNKQTIGIFKFLSPYKDDLYKVRSIIFNFMNRYYPQNFYLYGKGWDKLPLVYKGVVKNKIKTLSKFKFCLAFENTIAPGYITEKIFDAFKSGSIPIYFGAPNIKDYISENTFIDYRDFNNNPEKLMKFLLKMNDVTYNKYILNINKYLANKKNLEKWSIRSFEKQILENL